MSELSQDGRNSPVLTNGNDDIPTGAGSKYQQKKAKKQAKKQAKVLIRCIKRTFSFACVIDR